MKDFKKIAIYSAIGLGILGITLYETKKGVIAGATQIHTLAVAGINKPDASTAVSGLASVTKAVNAETFFPFNYLALWMIDIGVTLPSWEAIGDEYFISSIQASYGGEGQTSSKASSGINLNTVIGSVKSIAGAATSVGSVLTSIF